MPIWIATPIRVQFATPSAQPVEATGQEWRQAARVWEFVDEIAYRESFGMITRHEKSSEEGTRAQVDPLTISRMVDCCFEGVSAAGTTSEECASRRSGIS
jgi:hypothetical protein